jgi:hypothetical protein
MSPNEFQLRAALRDGEGEHLDPDTVIARARAVTRARRDRRVRYLSVAAVVAVVGGIGTVAGVALSGGDHNDMNSSSGAAKRMSTAGGGSAGAGQAASPKPAIAAGPMADAAAVPCPATAPALKLPGGGANDRFGAGGSLFSGPVEAVKLCAYQQQDRIPIVGPDGQPMNTVLTGAPATQLTASLDAAPKTRPRTPCPMYLSAEGKTLVIIGLSTSGHAMAPITAVVAQNPCNQPVTNGTAVRYNWSAPASLNTFIARLAPAHGGGAVPVRPSGRVTGSPVHS